MGQVRVPADRPASPDKKKMELLPLNLHYALSGIQSTIDRQRLQGTAAGNTLKC